jgi:hypothetical protein
VAVLCFTVECLQKQVCCVNPRRSESICRLKRTPLPVLAFTRSPDRNKWRCSENLVQLDSLQRIPPLLCQPPHKHDLQIVILQFNANFEGFLVRIAEKSLENHWNKQTEMDSYEGQTTKKRKAILFWDFQLFRPEYHWRDLSRNAHIWCIKIGIVLVLHFNPWVEA